MQKKLKAKYSTGEPLTKITIERHVINARPVTNKGSEGNSLMTLLLLCYY